VFEGLRAGLPKDRSQFYGDVAAAFYGANQAGAKMSQRVLEQFWLWSMQSGPREHRREFDTCRAELPTLSTTNVRSGPRNSQKKRHTKTKRINPPKHASDWGV
jgi:hypothetical protein